MLRIEQALPLRSSGGVTSMKWKRDIPKALRYGNNVVLQLLVFCQILAKGGWSVTEW